MTWLDYVTIGLIVLFIFIEVKRGAICAIIDTVGIWAALKIAAVSYRGLASPTFSQTAAYLTVFLVLAAVTIVISYLIHNQWKSDMGTFDSAIASAFGILVGLCFAHVAFGAGHLAYGLNGEVMANSLFRAQVYELHAAKGFLLFMSNIGDY